MRIVILHTVNGKIKLKYTTYAKTVSHGKVYDMLLHSKNIALIDRQTIWLFTLQI